MALSKARGQVDTIFPRGMQVSLGWVFCLTWTKQWKSWCCLPCLHGAIKCGLQLGGGGRKGDLFLIRNLPSTSPVHPKENWPVHCILAVCRLSLPDWTPVRLCLFDPTHSAYHQGLPTMHCSGRTQQSEKNDNSSFILHHFFHSAILIFFWGLGFFIVVWFEFHFIYFV